MGDDAEFKRRRTPKATGYNEGAGPSHQRMESETEDESDSMQYESKPAKDIRRTVTTDEAHGRDPGSVDTEAAAGERLFYRRHFPEEDCGGLESSESEEESSSTSSTGSSVETVIALRPKPSREFKYYLPRIHERSELEERDQQGEGDTASFSSHSQKTSRTTDDDFGRSESQRSVERSLGPDEAWGPVSKSPVPESSKVAVRPDEAWEPVSKSPVPESSKVAVRPDEAWEPVSKSPVSESSKVAVRPDEAWEPVSKSPVPESSKVAVSRKRKRHQRLEVLGKDTTASFSSHSQKTSRTTDDDFGRSESQRSVERSRKEVKVSDEFSRQHRRSKSAEDFNPHVKQHRKRRASEDFTDNTLDECENLEEEVCYEESHPSHQRRKGSVEGKRSPGQKRKFISSYEDYSSSLQQHISSPIKHQTKKQLHKIPTEQRLQLTERRSSETSYPDSTVSTRKPTRKHSRVRRQSETSFITSVLEDLHDDIQEELPKSEDTTSATWGSSSRPLETSKSPDKIYVQGREGFTPRPISRDPWQRTWSVSRPGSVPFYQKWRLPIELAIFFQRNVRKLYTVCHGLLGGFGFAHCVLVLTFGVEERDVTLVSEVYAYMSRIVKTWYYFFAVICLVSVLDRWSCDFMQRAGEQIVERWRPVENWEDSNEVVKVNAMGPHTVFKGIDAGADLVHVHRHDFMDCQCYRVLDTILVLIYFCVLFLSNISAAWEDKLSVRSRIHDNFPAGSQISREEFMAWKKVSVFRGFLAVVGWILISVSEQTEMLLIHLRNMLKYWKKKKKKRRRNIATIN